MGLRVPANVCTFPSHFQALSSFLCLCVSAPCALLKHAAGMLPVAAVWILLISFCRPRVCWITLCTALEISHERYVMRKEVGGSSDVFQTPFSCGQDYVVFSGMSSLCLMDVRASLK